MDTDSYMVLTPWLAWRRILIFIILIILVFIFITVKHADAFVLQSLPSKPAGQAGKAPQAAHTSNIEPQLLHHHPPTSSSR
jgi:Na+/H+-translocating membrane pyrophosphatase